MAKESRDQWGRRVLRPCPFCGGKGSQPNGKVFVNITHKQDCWILKRHEYYGFMTRVDEDDVAWNERAADSNRMSEVLEPTTTTQGWAGPQTHEEANCYHQGFLGGLTVYARERGESTLKSQNPLLARLMDEQGFATIETFERLPAITPAGFALTKDELKLCAELPDALVSLADFHDSKASMAAAMGYRESTDHHSARAEELKAEAKRIEATW